MALLSLFALYLHIITFFHTTSHNFTSYIGSQQLFPTVNLSSNKLVPL